MANGTTREFVFACGTMTVYEITSIGTSLSPAFPPQFFVATATAFRSSPSVAALAVIVMLNVVNPDALIVRRNAALAMDRPFDIAYAMGLSADAIPRVVDSLDRLPADQRCAAGAAFSIRKRGHTGWRSSIWARQRSNEELGQLRTSGGCTP